MRQKYKVLSLTPQRVHTVTVTASEMGVTELPNRLQEQVEGDSVIFDGLNEMTMPPQPGWVQEHIRSPVAAGIQGAFQC